MTVNDFTLGLAKCEKDERAKGSPAVAKYGEHSVLSLTGRILPPRTQLKHISQAKAEVLHDVYESIVDACAHPYGSEKTACLERYLDVSSKWCLYSLRLWRRQTSGRYDKGSYRVPRVI